jgi:hypothetical protein
MRSIILLILLSWTSSAYSQDFSVYKDSLYQFQIGIPSGWRYGKPESYPDLLLISIRPMTDTTEKFVENFNVNVIKEANSNLDSAFAHMLKYNSMTDDFKVLEKGEKIINGQDFRWVVSTHTNKYNTQLMYNYVLITYDEAKAYILTMVSTPKNFETYRPLFEKIAQTFKVNNTR